MVSLVSGTTDKRGKLANKSLSQTCSTQVGNTFIYLLVEIKQTRIHCICVMYVKPQWMTLKDQSMHLISSFLEGVVSLILAIFINLTCFITPLTNTTPLKPTYTGRTEDQLTTSIPTVKPILVFTMQWSLDYPP